MKPSYTNRAIKWKGDSTSVTVRLPAPVVEYMDTIPDPTLRNRSEFLQHWAMVGMVVMRDPELLDAVQWALAQAERPLLTILDAPMEAAGNGQVTKNEDWKDYYTSVIIDNQTIERIEDPVDWGAVARGEYDPLQLTGDEDIEVLPEGAVIHLNEEGGEILVPDEVETIHDAQLEELRNRIR
jgi:hypothetical protein